MNSEHMELLKKLLQEEIYDCDASMFDEAGKVDDWNYGRLYLASQLLCTIELLEKREGTEETEGK